MVWLAGPIWQKQEMFLQQSNAMNAVRTIHAAQTQYRAQFGHFATSLAQLGPPVSGTPNSEAADLISGDDLARAVNPRYRLVLDPAPDGYTVTVYGANGKIIFTDPSTPPTLR